MAGAPVDLWRRGRVDALWRAREMYGVVEVGEITLLEWALVVLFVITFSWIAFAFMASVYGFVALLRAPRLGPCRSASRARRRW